MYTTFSSNKNISSFNNEEIGEIIFNLCSLYYNEGYTPNYLLCNKSACKRIKNVLRNCKISDTKYQTDFGLLEIINTKMEKENWISVKEKL